MICQEEIDLDRNSRAECRTACTQDVAFGEGVELVVIRSGDVVTLYPAATSIPEMIARLDALPRPPSIEECDDDRCFIALPMLGTLHLRVRGLVPQSE